MLSGGAICRLWYDLRRRCVFISAIWVSLFSSPFPSGTTCYTVLRCLSVCLTAFLCRFSSACLPGPVLAQRRLAALLALRAKLLVLAVFACFPPLPVHCVSTYAVPDMGYFSFLSFLSACLFAFLFYSNSLSLVRGLALHFAALLSFPCL